MHAQAAPALIPRPEPSDRLASVHARSVSSPDEYWLEHCEGFRVDGPGGRIGFVEEVRSNGAGFLVLAVRAGLFGRRLLMFPATEVAHVVPQAQRVWLRSSALLASEPMLS